MDSQQTNKDWPHVFFSIFLLYIYIYIYTYIFICKKDVYIKNNLVQIAQSSPKIYKEKKGHRRNYKPGESKEKR